MSSVNVTKLEALLSRVQKNAVQARTQLLRPVIFGAKAAIVDAPVLESRKDAKDVAGKQPLPLADTNLTPKPALTIEKTSGPSVWGKPEASPLAPPVKTDVSPVPPAIKLERSPVPPPVAKAEISPAPPQVKAPEAKVALPVEPFVESSFADDSADGEVVELVELGPADEVYDGEEIVELVAVEEVNYSHEDIEIEASATQSAPTIPPVAPVQESANLLDDVSFEERKLPSKEATSVPDFSDDPFEEPSLAEVAVAIGKPEVSMPLPRVEPVEQTVEADVVSLVGDKPASPMAMSPTTPGLSSLGPLSPAVSALPKVAVVPTPSLAGAVVPSLSVKAPVVSGPSVKLPDPVVSGPSVKLPAPVVSGPSVKLPEPIQPSSLTEDPFADDLESDVFGEPAAPITASSPATKTDAPPAASDATSPKTSVVEVKVPSAPLPSVAVAAPPVVSAPKIELPTISDNDFFEPEPMTFRPGAEEDFRTKAPAIAKSKEPEQVHVPSVEPKASPVLLPQKKVEFPTEPVVIKHHIKPADVVTVLAQLPPPPVQTFGSWLDDALKL